MLLFIINNKYENKFIDWLVSYWWNRLCVFCVFIFYKCWKKKLFGLIDLGYVVWCEKCLVVCFGYVIEINWLWRFGIKLYILGIGYMFGKLVSVIR